MKTSWHVIMLVGVLLTGCGRESNETQPTAHQSAPEKPLTLSAARQGFTTKLRQKESAGVPIPNPPPELFRVISYPSAIGEMGAYVGVDPKDGRKHPAIIWLVGGFDGSISEIAWEPGPPSDDQSASAFREAGIIMMYPSVRGGNQNPGHHEGLYGEVDDILAAAEFLAKQDYVDPERIYLGGHSTGGTLALLVAECSDRFRAVFAFGPVGDIAGYGQENLPFNLSNAREAELRSPVEWLESVTRPVFVLEGTLNPGNLSELRLLSRTSKNPNLHFHPVRFADHFSALQPITRVIASRIISDAGPACGISFTDSELAEAMRRQAH